jgi:uncharacterized protein (TIGR02145 family)
MDAGNQCIALPYRCTGIYLYKIKAGNNEYVIKGISVGGALSGSRVISQGYSSNNPLTKQAKVTVAINDIIEATKTGYLKYREIVTNSDTSDVEIRMIVCADTIRDGSGNLYQAVRIGNQVWTVENLRTMTYSDGTLILCDTSQSTWNSGATAKYCYYGNTTNADSISKFGAIYNWYAINPSNPKKIAPAGWHVPSDAEWDTLVNYLTANGYNWNGTTTTNKIAKSLASKADWKTNTDSGTIGNDLSKNNRSGFSALPGGIRDGSGSFNGIGSIGHFWSVTEQGTLGAWIRALSYDFDGLYRYNKNWAFSVRLVRD